MSHPDPSPAVGVERQYADFLAQGVWRVPRCTACDRVVFYPRQICPHCGGAAFTWFSPSGHGVVHATTTVRRGEAAGGDVNVCLVDLAEGFRMMSRVEGIAPDAPRIGDTVIAGVSRTGGAPLVVFNLVESRA